MDQQQETVIPQKSPNDERLYEAITLPNGIRVLFIQDAKAQKGACSISVGVGSFRDGEKSFGLAHFLEHMLFMGSRKFPSHNEFSEFISLNSGSDNAWTSDEETNYYFQISTAKFLEGVERLADFFVEAALSEDCITKERQAVHEECQLRCGEDNSRKWEILKHFASGPYHNHSFGNNNTLSYPEVGQDLRNFYKNQYSANRINAVLLSMLPIAEMKAATLPYFLEIKDKKLPPLNYQAHFQTEKVGKLVRMRSIKDEAIMEFFWVVDCFRTNYKWHPERYLTHVLGHEGQNSLLSLLKEKQFATKLTCYSHDLPPQSILAIEIQLTEEGRENYQSIYNMVCDYTSWLKADSRIYEQIREASAVSFRFKEKSPNYQYVTELSSSMHRVPLPEVISWRAHYAPFDAGLIDSYLRQLNPFNLLLVYSNSDELTNPIQEPHFGGTFEVHDLPARVIQNIGFQPLRKNPFLPLATDLLPADTTNGVVVRSGNVYYSRGAFEVCKGGVRLSVHAPAVEVFLELYAIYLELLFKELTYEAETLKLQIQYGDEDQLTIEIFGFSDTVQKLLSQLAPLLTSAHQLPNAESLFELAREDLLEEYQNFYMGEVDEIAETHLDILLQNNAMPVAASLQALEEYEYESFCQLIEGFWKRARLEWVVVGNFPQAIVQTLGQYQRLISCGSESKEEQLRCLRLKQSLTQCTVLEVEDVTTSGCIKYHQIGPYSERLYYTLSLLVNYIKEPYFDKLRTEKQLAYYLRAYPKNTQGVLALCFILISSNTDPRAVSNHITTFCNDFLSAAESDLTAQKFSTIKSSVKTKGLEPHNSLKDYFEFVYHQIDKKTFLFHRKERQTLDGFLDSITREEVLSLFKGTLQKALQVWIVAKNHKEEFLKVNEEFAELEALKAAAQYYPEWKGVI